MLRSSHEWAAVVATAFVGTVLAASHVVDLEPSNFDEVVDGSRHALVEFFAPCTFSFFVFFALIRGRPPILIPQTDADRFCSPSMR